MYRLKINNRTIYCPKDMSVIEACFTLGIKIPRFCYHEKLSIAGSCRMCLVETNKAPKPIAACASPIVQDLEVITNSPLTLKSRENILELLLIHHPLDCPICDQGGECDLQDQYMKNGAFSGRYKAFKRGVEDKICGPFIKTIMTRCIQCTRCVRFNVEINGLVTLGSFNRGINMEIGTYISKTLDMGISGNLIDLCPVGALTSKASAFTYRPWEIHAVENIDLTDSNGSSIYVCLNEYGPVRILPKKNIILNETWITDKARFCVDFFNNKSKKKFIFSMNFKKQTILIINKEVDLKTLNLMQHLMYVSGEIIKILVLSSQKYITNFIYWNTPKKITDLYISTECILLSTNIKIENILLNTKLHGIMQQKKISIFNIGIFFKTTFFISFIGLGLNNIKNFIHGKLLNFSKYFFYKQNVTILLGITLLNRFYNIEYFFKKIQQHYPTFIFFKLNLSCNANALSLINFFPLNSHFMNINNNVLGLSIDDTILSRKILLNFNKNFTLGISKFSDEYWNTHTFPVEYHYMHESIYINIEQKPQISNKVLPTSLLSIENYVNTLISLYYFKNQEIAIAPWILSIAKNAYKSYAIKKGIYLTNNIPYLYINNSYSTYPLKPVFENMYAMSLITKNSKTLVEATMHLFQEEYNL